MIHDDIKNGIKEALMSKNTVLLETLRGMLSAFMNDLVARGKKPNETLSDEEALTVIARLAKQRKDSIEQFRAGGRADLVETEEAQLKILEQYLPKMMERDEVESVVRAKMNELGITDDKEKGKLMSGVMAELRGKADGKMVKEVVDTIFN